MTHNKQTSVDQLFDQLSSENLLGLFTHDQMMRAMEILDEAKAMHKEEIIDAHLEGQCDGTEGYPLEIAKKFYKQTYGGNK